jgi:hypothetical protein
MSNDLRVTDEGAISLLSAISKDGRNLINENVPSDRAERAGSIAVEHRHIADIIRDARAKGLTVEETTLLGDYAAWNRRPENLLIEKK